MVAVAAGRIWSATEFDRLLACARRGWLSGRRPWLGVALAVGTVVVFVLLRTPGVGSGIWRSGLVYAALPVDVEVRRIPMSFLLPTPFLPVWAAAAQILIVVGLGEIVLGRCLTLVVGAIGHFGATLTTRLVLESGQGTVFALPHALAHSLDTGPSAAVTAVGACLLVGLHMNRLAVVLCASLIVAAAVAPGIDGQEHLVALGVGVFAGGAYRWSRRFSIPSVGLLRPIRTE